MYKILPFLALISLVLSQDIGPLVAQIPQCFVPCFATIIGNACGNPNDWACGCASNQVSDFNTACEAAVYECTIPEGQEMVSLIGQICGLEAQAHGTGTAAASPSDTGGLPSATPSAGGGGSPAAGVQTPTSTAVLQKSVMVNAPTPVSTGGSPSQQNTPSHSSAGLSLESIVGAAWLAVGAGSVLAILVSF